MSYLTIDQVIGNTPLVQLQRIPGADNARRGNVILGKLEGNNPAGSVKDRAAISMIRHAQERGAIKPGERFSRGPVLGSRIRVNKERLEKQVDLVIEAGYCGPEATTVIDLTSGSPQLVRAGRGALEPFGLEAD